MVHHDEQESKAVSQDTTTNEDESPRTRRRLRSLPSSRKKTKPPVSQKSPESADGADSVGSSKRGGAKEDDDAAKMSEDEASQDVSMKESSSFQDEKEEEDELATTQGALEAIMPNGARVTVRVLVNGTPFDAVDASTTASPTVGQDGNNFYCDICNGVGEIVCCDGCPKAFHPTCIEEGTPSRIALDNDADPWFCPDCLAENKGDSSIASRRTSRRMCSECRQSGGDNPILPCERCSAYIHHPSCQTQPDDEMEEDSAVLCSNCAAGDVVSQEEDELGLRAPTSQEEQSSRRLRRRSSIGAYSPLDDEMSDDQGEEDDGGGKRRSKRKRSVDHSAEKPPAKKQVKERSSVKKQRKAKRKRSTQSYEEVPSDDQSESPIYERTMPRSYTAPQGLVKATPAFFFFINDHRYKIERSLSRKHRYFNRLPKGLERNQLIAREAAIWWVKLRPTDHRRYMKMSMNDFEERVIEWKEEKGHEVSMMDPQDAGEAQCGGENQASDVSPDDERITYERHKKLYMDTSVGSKPFVPEPGKSNNRLLLELLQDMRFHTAVPMLQADRSDEEPGQVDHSKMAIPYFEVHGPVATSVGDECLGCVRGWHHFCPVLQRKIPAVEHRSKLQGPLSSLMATRVGLGLRPRLQTASAESPDAEEEWKKAENFSEQETTQAKESKKLPPISSYPLTQSSARADDVVTFMEAAMAMKVSEPPRPSDPGPSRFSQLSRGTLPMHGRKKRKKRQIGPTLNKCGRCRAVIQTDTGCVPCRRAQLVIDTSRQQQSRTDDSLLKVQTSMLGRLSSKDSNFEEQSAGDAAVSKAMLKVRWSPNAVLPPQRIPAPVHKPDSSSLAESTSGSESSGDEDVSMDISMEAPIAPGQPHETSAKGLVTIEEERTVRGDIGSMNSNETDGSLESTEGRASRKRRARRESATFSTAAVEEAEADRRQIAREQQEEASLLNKRCVSVACCGILLAMTRRDPLLLFAEPVPADVEAYSKIVTDPIDFGKIKSKVLKDEYKTLGAFVSDARLLCTNALAYNPVGTIYNKTAKELLDVLEVMQKRAVEWTTAIKNAHASSSVWRKAGSSVERLNFDHDDTGAPDDPFSELRQSWPAAVDILESGDWLRSQVASDFVRTRENETAYYGSIAIRRAAIAADASLASYPDTGGMFNPVVRRSHTEDEALRGMIDKRVADEVARPVELKDAPNWREDAILKILRRVQTERVEARVGSHIGCARCDGARIDQEAKQKAESIRWGRNKKKGEIDTIPRVASSRVPLSTGLGSSKNREAMNSRQTESDLPEGLGECIGEVGVSVRGSPIHGWGLFADQPFKPGDVVAEYVGEYVTHAAADRREKMYQEQRIQDYQFRADELVIDATLKGGHGRYINHNCTPNCIARIVEGKPPNPHLKRVIIIAQSDIKAMEEITYDYQFPLELELDARIPCNCGSPSCRGFMNWDLPEKGARTRIVRGSKRGGNMRDRIRRLNRPRKRDGDAFI